MAAKSAVLAVSAEDVVQVPTHHTSKVPVKDNLFAEFAISGVSVATASTFTNPLDVIKTRLQLQGRIQADGSKAPGLLKTGINIAKQEGVPAFWHGLSPAVARGLFYGGLRLGLYSPFKNALSLTEGSAGAPVSAGFQTKLLAGALSGGLAAALSSPFELIKTRLQAKDNVQPGAVAVVRKVVADSGVIGLWRGAVPGMARASLLTSSQCATYDEVKRAVMTSTGWSDCSSTHFVASAITGLVTTTVTNPADVIKTHMFVGGSSGGGVVTAFKEIATTDGPSGFMKGWTANYARLGPQTIIIFVVAEALRNLMGMSTL